ncbi:MAG TPA: CRISPR-associated protein [Lentisphaeria bacterium]|nr:MAG: hypothetical protein A2X47_04890 [Lentisphaerae bacterium GWF2_38_69]HBM16329.1 CRISPR-associated protein [Lentisphaeria bacterium]
MNDSDNRPVAHSAKIINGVYIEKQYYDDHVLSVAERARRNAESATDGLNKSPLNFVSSVYNAGLFHDLGKLDPENQEVLNAPDSHVSLPINHVDAGTTYFLRNRSLEPAVLVYGHHIGLLSKSKELEKPSELFLRDPKFKEITDKSINEYENLHKAYINKSFENITATLPWSGLTRRLALSCIVDADYGDTAKHYQQESAIPTPDTKWEDRLKALDEYVSKLKDPNDERSQIRSDIYSACKESKINNQIRSCDSPVGTGKTTAVMVYLLKVAIEKRLKHIFVVLPYTNIINQSVDVYRKALTLEGENPEHVVAAHHHQADFSDFNCRQLASLWNSPIIVTTAVQFFETLSSSTPSKLRKLHELPHSAVFIDEAHAAIPVYQWPQQWIWIRELANCWNCYFVLASGSLARFWTLKEFVNPPENEIADIIPDELRKKAESYEKARIAYIRKREEAPFNKESLKEFVLSEKGPRLIIFNTVQSAAIFAKLLNHSDNNVEHLSTALSPADRARIINRIKNRLKENSSDWTLVATSCVEAGMNFSFQTAFRESASLASLIQVGGRINRDGERNDAKVYDFRIADPLFNSHPAFESSRIILEFFLTDNILEKQHPSIAMTRALQEEIKLKDISIESEKIRIAENRMDYPDVEALCKVINSDTRLVVVNKIITARMEKGDKITPIDLIQNSVQIWMNKINNLALEQIRGYSDIYKWSYEYDQDFLGYMKGMIPVIEFKDKGCAIL